MGMDVAAAQANLSSALIVSDTDRAREIAEQERFRQLEMQQQTDAVTASRAPEQAAGQIVDEIV